MSELPKSRLMCGLGSNGPDRDIIVCAAYLAHHGHIGPSTAFMIASDVFTKAFGTDTPAAQIIRSVSAEMDMHANAIEDGKSWELNAYLKPTGMPGVAQPAQPAAPRDEAETVRDVQGFLAKLRETLSGELPRDAASAPLLCMEIIGPDGEPYVCTFFDGLVSKWKMVNKKADPEAHLRAEVAERAGEPVHLDPTVGVELPTVWEPESGLLWHHVKIGDVINFDNPTERANNDLSEDDRVTVETISTYQSATYGSVTFGVGFSRGPTTRYSSVTIKLDSKLTIYDRPTKTPEPAPSPFTPAEPPSVPVPQAGTPKSSETFADDAAAKPVDEQQDDPQF